MTSRSLSRSLLSAATVALMLPTPSTVHATGGWNPVNLLGDHQYAALSSPEFWFELEMKELAKEFPVPEKHSEKFVGEADMESYDEAVKAGKVKVADPAAYRKVLGEKRLAINKASEGSLLEPDPNAEPPDPDAAPKPGDPTAAAPAKPVGPGTEPLPTDEFGLYLRGAEAYVAHDFAAAVAAWKALLALPEDARRYRTVWAEYMLGMCAVAEKRRPEAPAHFQKTRELAAAGFFDPLGLAAASYGWEAYAHKESDLEKAMTLYLKQLASGDVHAVASIRSLVPSIGGEEEAAGEGGKPKEPGKAENPVEKLARSPVLQRIVTRWFLAMGSDMNNRYAGEASNDPGPAQWLEALEKTRPTATEADRLGWLAYRQGQYAQAARWLKLVPSDTRLSLWLTAKLALRAGDTAKAAKAMQQVTEMPPATEEKLVISQNGSELALPTSTARAEQAAIALSRSQYADSLTAFMRAGYWSDAAYVAERVMTVDELQKYVDEHFPKPADEEYGGNPREGLAPVVTVPAGEPTPADLKRKAKEEAEAKAKEAGREATDPAAEGDDLHVDVSESILYQQIALENIPPDHPAARDAMAWRLRWLLARRMVREDREAAARPYFTREMQPVLDAYLSVLKTAADKKAPARQRAIAWWKAAWLARHAGMELMGTEIWPDNAFEGGSFAAGSLARERRSGFEDPAELEEGEKAPPPKKIAFALPPSADEKKRLAKHVLSHENRYHYRWVAAVLAKKAAALLPDGSEEKADVLNQAGSWLFDRDVKGEEAFFFEIGKSCANTKVGQEVLEKKHTSEDIDGPWSGAEPQ